MDSYLTACRRVHGDDFSDSFIYEEGDLSAHHMAYRCCIPSTSLTCFSLFQPGELGQSDPAEWEKRVKEAASNNFHEFVNEQFAPSEFNAFYQVFRTMLTREADYILDWVGYNPFEPKGIRLPQNIKTIARALDWMLCNGRDLPEFKEFCLLCRNGNITPPINKDSYASQMSQARTRQNQKQQKQVDLN